MERAERDFSGQSLGASSEQLVQLAANHVPFETYHAGEPEQRAQWSLSVLPALLLLLGQMLQQSCLRSANIREYVRNNLLAHSKKKRSLPIQGLLVACH